MANTKIDDREMEKATGGMTLDELNNHGMKKYDDWGIVVGRNENGYLVKLDSGAEVTATFEQKHVVPEGTRVALIMLMGGWIMEEIRCF